MTLKLVNFVMTPKRYPQNLHTPKKYSFFWKPKKILKFRILNPKKMVRAYVCVKILGYPPPPPWAKMLSVLNRVIWSWIRVLTGTIDTAWGVECSWVGPSRVSTDVRLSHAHVRTTMLKLIREQRHFLKLFTQTNTAQQNTLWGMITQGQIKALSQIAHNIIKFRITLNPSEKVL